jgi:hypothetical protein
MPDAHQASAAPFDAVHSCLLMFLKKKKIMLTDRCSAGPLRLYASTAAWTMPWLVITDPTEADLTARKECYVVRGCASRVHV